jgi:hypothetical protein
VFTLAPPPRSTLTPAGLDALCGGAPDVMVPCPRFGCDRQLGPYYSATSPEARAALAEHLHLTHIAVWESAGVYA